MLSALGSALTTLMNRLRRPRFDRRGIRLPESLSTKPNIPWHQCTVAQLEEERDYWKTKASSAPGPASAGAAHEFMLDIEAELRRRAQRMKKEGISYDY